MKYLSSRDNYLKNLNERRNIEKINQINQIKPLLENYASSGPFTNELRWGDSLLGRLIHSITRKAIIGTKMLRIKGVAERLYQAMDDLLITSTISDLDDDDKKLWSRAIIAEYLIAIQEAVDDYAEGKNGVKLVDIKNYVDTAIEKAEQEETLEKKNELLRRLNDFKKFLEPFKDEEGDEVEEGESDELLDALEEGWEEAPIPEGEEDKWETKTITEEDGTEIVLRRKKGESNVGSDSGDSGTGEYSPNGMYPTMIKALKSLSLILVNYKKFKPGSQAKDVAMGGESVGYITKGGETIEGIQKDTTINKNKLTIDQIWSQNNKVLQPYAEKAEKMKMDKNKIQLTKGLRLNLASVKESYLYEAGPIAGSNREGSDKPIGSGAGTQRNIGSGAESHSTQAYMKLKSACQQLEDSKTKGVGITVDFINEITSKSVDEDTKKAVKSLFVEINRYLVGDKKDTLNAATDTLFKENLQIISDKNTKIVVAEKIARFTKRAMQFDGKNLYGELGDLGKPLQEYVESFKQLSKMTSGGPEKEEKTEKKVESQKESLVFRYDKFISYIKEADEDDVDDVKKKSVPIKIQDYLTQKIDFSEWVLDKSEVQKVKTAMEKKMAENKDSITINGIDPVLDIVRCFNRAYKLHTVSVIPSNRTGGEVSNKIFREYESFGNGTPDSAGKSGGPYRNIAIFNIWEDEVLKVMKDKEYQKIFNVGTRLKVGNEYIEKAGMNLRKFMNDMLDGDELYKSGESGSAGGAQAKFLDKYFGYKDGEKDGGRDLSFDSSGNEMSDNSKNADDIKPMELKVVPQPIKFDDPSDLSNTFFVISGSKDGDQKNYFCYIHEVRGDIAYVSFCKSSYHILKYISKSKAGQTVKPDNVLNSLSLKTDKNQNDYSIKGTRIEISKFWDKSGKFINGSTVDISCMEKESKEEGDKKVPTNDYNAKCVLDDAFRLQSVKFFNIVDLNQGQNQDSYKRIKAKEKEVNAFIVTEGGFTSERILKEPLINNVRIKNA
jgi:hypothetical protein